MFETTLKSILLATSCLSTGLTLGSDKFDLVVFPWIIEGTSTEFKSLNEVQLEESITELAQSIGKPVSLQKLYGTEPNYVRNIFKALGEYTAVKLDEKLGNDVTVQPYICKLADTLVVSTAINQWNGYRVVALAHQTVIDNKSPGKPLKSGLLRDALRESYRKAVRNIKSDPPQDNLKIKITNKKNTRFRLGSISKCLSHLLTEKLSQKYQMITDHGYDHYSLVERSKLKPRVARTRPTRQFILDWYNLKEKTYQFKLWKAESIFSHRITEEISHQFQLEIEDFSFEIESNKELEDYLDEQVISLKLAEMPQISKVFKAWVYLDKGRAWGLKIGDRLAAKAPTGETIKGHIVGFFGPNQNILSPRGFNVPEGAIMYVRKGQLHVDIGQTMEWDKRSFPTPWPPSQGM